MHSRIGLVLLLAVMVPAGIAPGKSKPKAPATRQTLPEKAAVLWESAMSQYNSKRWDQARPLLEDFTKKYITNEKAAEAFVRIAYCALKQDDQAGFDKAVDDCIKNFTGSSEWYYVYGAKLKNLRLREDRDGYVKAFGEMSEKTPIIPNDLRSFGKKSYFGLTGRSYEVDFRCHLGNLKAAPNTNCWTRDMIWAGDTPDRAGKLLKALSKTLKTGTEDLSPDMQHAHYRLLLAAEKDKEAPKVLEAYLKSWDDDIRGVKLRMLFVWDMLAEGVPHDRGEEFFKELVETYIHYSSMREWTGRLLPKIYERGDFEHYAPLAQAYCKLPYSGSGGPFHAIGNRQSTIGRIASLASARDKETKKQNLEHVAQAIKILEEIPVFLPDGKRGNLDSLIRLHQATGDSAKAAELAGEMLDKYWCSWAYETIKRRIKNNEEMKKVFEKACAKWGVPKEPKKDEKDKDSPAAKKLATIKEKINDDRANIAEELAEEMIKTHKDAPETIQAVSLLSQHFFKKLLPEQRDKWAEKMVSLWPKHPLTEKVIGNQITACKAARKPEDSIVWLKRLVENFPGIQGMRWYEKMVWYYDSVKNAEGKYKFQQEFFGPFIQSNSLFAKQMLLLGEFKLEKTKEDADEAAFWNTKGKELAGTPLEPWAYRHAWSKAFQWHKPDDTDLGAAQTAVEGLQKQTYDPETQWIFAFGKPYVLAQKSKGAEAKKELDAILSKAGKKKFHDLHLRIDLPVLGSALGEAKNVAGGMKLSKKLRSVCPSTRDQCAIALMLARLYKEAGDSPKAFRYFSGVAHAAKIPGQVVDIFVTAVHELKDVKDFNPETETRKFMKKIPRVHSAQARLLGLIAGRHFHGSKTAFQKAYRELAKKYPASKALGGLDEMIKKREDAKKEKKTKGKKP